MFYNTFKILYFSKNFKNMQKLTISGGLSEYWVPYSMCMTPYSRSPILFMKRTLIITLVGYSLS